MKYLLLRVSTRKSKKVNPARRRVKYAPVAQRRLAERSSISHAHRAPMERDKVTVGVTRTKWLGKTLNTRYVFIALFSRLEWPPKSRTPDSLSGRYDMIPKKGWRYDT
jgi:hypothetical protein